MVLQPKQAKNISGYVTEMIVFALETHHQYLFQTKKKQIYSCTIATAGW